jgi:protein-tyrosine-phosphatase
MPRVRVLFVCIGNSCRSQMAEGFARKYGADVMEPYSAGLGPAAIVAPLTAKVMLEKNVDMSSHFPKGLESVGTGPFDLMINMSGQRMPAPQGVTVEEWKVRDPMGLSEEIFRQVANEIEQRVMRLVLLLRAQQQQQSKRPAASRRI